MTFVFVFGISTILLYYQIACCVYQLIIYRFTVMIDYCSPTIKMGIHTNAKHTVSDTFINSLSTVGKTFKVKSSDVVQG